MWLMRWYYWRCSSCICHSVVPKDWFRTVPSTEPCPRVNTDNEIEQVHVKFRFYLLVKTCCRHVVIRGTRRQASLSRHFSSSAQCQS